MEVNLKSNANVFKPFSIEIKFDTLEEVALIDQMLMANCRIPEMLLKDGSLKTADEEAKLLKLMSKIREPSLS